MNRKVMGRYTRKKGGEPKTEIEPTEIEKYTIDLVELDSAVINPKKNPEKTSIFRKVLDIGKKTLKKVNDFGDNTKKYVKDKVAKLSYATKLLIDVSNIDKLHLKNQFYLQYMNMETVRRIHADVPNISWYASNLCKELFDMALERKEMNDTIELKEKIKKTIRENKILNLKRETLNIGPTIIGNSFKLLDSFAPIEPKRTKEIIEDEKKLLLIKAKKIIDKNKGKSEFNVLDKSILDDLIEKIKSKKAEIENYNLFEETMKKIEEKKSDSGLKDSGLKDSGLKELELKIKESEKKRVEYKEIDNEGNELSEETKQLIQEIDNTDTKQFALGIFKDRKIFNEDDWVPKSTKTIKKSFEVSFSNLNSKHLIERETYEHIEQSIIDEIFYFLGLGDEIERRIMIEDALNYELNEEEIDDEIDEKIQNEKNKGEITKRIHYLRTFYSNYICFKKIYDPLYKYLHNFRFLIQNALYSGISKSIFVIDDFNEKIFRCLKENDKVSTKYKNSLMSIFVMLRALTAAKNVVSKASMGITDLFEKMTIELKPLAELKKGESEKQDNEKKGGNFSKKITDSANYLRKTARKASNFINIKTKKNLHKLNMTLMPFYSSGNFGMRDSMKFSAIVCRLQLFYDIDNDLMPSYNRFKQNINYKIEPIYQRNEVLKCLMVMEKIFSVISTCSVSDVDKYVIFEQTTINKMASSLGTLKKRFEKEWNPEIKLKTSYKNLSTKESIKEIIDTVFDTEIKEIKESIISKNDKLIDNLKDYIEYEAKQKSEMQNTIKDLNRIKNDKVDIDHVKEKFKEHTITKPNGMDEESFERMIKFKKNLDSKILKQMNSFFKLTNEQTIEKFEEILKMIELEKPMNDFDEEYVSTVTVFFQEEITKITDKYAPTMKKIEDINMTLEPENDTTIMKHLINKINGYKDKVNKKIKEYIDVYASKTKYKGNKTSKGGNCNKISKITQTVGFHNAFYTMVDSICLTCYLNMLDREVEELKVLRDDRILDEDNGYIGQDNLVICLSTTIKYVLRMPMFVCISVPSQVISTLGLNTPCGVILHIFKDTLKTSMLFYEDIKYIFSPEKGVAPCNNVWDDVIIYVVQNNVEKLDLKKAVLFLESMRYRYCVIDNVKTLQESFPSKDLLKQILDNYEKTLYPKNLDPKLKPYFIDRLILEKIAYFEHPKPVKLYQLRSDIYDKEIFVINDTFKDFANAQFYQYPGKFMPQTYKIRYATNDEPIFNKVQKEFTKPLMVEYILPYGQEYSDLYSVIKNNTNKRKLFNIFIKRYEPQIIDFIKDFINPSKISGSTIGQAKKKLNELILDLANDPNISDFDLEKIVLFFENLKSKYNIDDFEKKDLSGSVGKNIEKYKNINVFLDSIIGLFTEIKKEKYLESNEIGARKYLIFEDINKKFKNINEINEKFEGTEYKNIRKKILNVIYKFMISDNEPTFEIEKLKENLQNAFKTEYIDALILSKYNTIGEINIYNLDSDFLLISKENRQIGSYFIYYGLDDTSEFKKAQKNLLSKRGITMKYKLPYGENLKMFKQIRDGSFDQLLPIYIEKVDSKTILETSKTSVSTIDKTSNIEPSLSISTMDAVNDTDTNSEKPMYLLSKDEYGAYLIDHKEKHDEFLKKVTNDVKKLDILIESFLNEVDNDEKKFDETKFDETKFEDFLKYLQLLFDRLNDFNDNYVEDNFTKLTDDENRKNFLNLINTQKVIVRTMKSRFSTKYENIKLEILYNKIQ
jgi:hypothetical protein